MTETQTDAQQWPEGLGGVPNIKDVIADLLQKDDTLYLMNGQALKNYFAEGIQEACSVKIDDVRLDRFDNEARSATITFTGSTRKMRAFARIQRSGLQQSWERDERQPIGETQILKSFG